VHGGWRAGDAGLIVDTSHETFRAGEWQQRDGLSSPTFLPALTAIRGIAAWWVVLFHFRDHFPLWMPAIVSRVAQDGYLAVDLFFQLSGLVIALNYERHLRHIAVAPIRRFLILRLARIYPLHLCVLLLFLLNPLAIMLFSATGETGTRFEPSYFGLSLLLVQNWGFTQELAWNIPAWSISTEWFAYLAFPVLILLLRLPRGTGMVVVAYGALATGLAAISWFAGAGLGDAIPQLGLPRCVIQFSMGICLYRLLTTCRSLPSSSLLLAAIGGFAAFVLLPLPDYAIMPVSISCLILSLTNNGGIAARLLRPQWLMWLGEVSYSTYLIHYFVKDWVKFLLVRDEVSSSLPLLAYLLVTLLASAVLFRFVEVPGRQRVKAWFGM
jgi:peptidoglycan/LPS O-acetylase OafA/YrhL